MGQPASTHFLGYCFKVFDTYSC